MFDRIRALLHRLHDLTAVDDFTQTDLDDLGLTRPQLRALIAIPAGVADRATRMAAIFGVPQTALQDHRADYIDILETCQHCGESRSCARKLAQGSLTQAAEAGFCPNAATYTGLAA